MLELRGSRQSGGPTRGAIGHAKCNRGSGKWHCFAHGNLRGDFGGGVWPRHFWPASFLPEGWGFPLGLIVIFAAVNIKLFAVREMVRVKTNLDIRKPANDIATSGLYSASRNPLYIGMILLNIGIGCIVNSLWILLLSAGLAATLQKGEKLILNKNLATNICATKPRSGAGSKITFRLADFTLAGVEPVYNPQDY